MCAHWKIKTANLGSNLVTGLVKDLLESDNNSWNEAKIAISELFSVITFKTQASDKENQKLNDSAKRVLTWQCYKPQPQQRDTLLGHLQRLLEQIKPD